MLDRDLIIKDLLFSSAEEAIRYGGELLLRKGYVTSGYTASVLAREQEFPTGLPTEPIAIAIPHTGSDYVIKSGMCLMVLKQPLEFCQMGDSNTRIKAEIIIMLAVSTAEGHLEFLSELLTLLSEDSLLERIHSARSTDEIYRLLTASGNVFKG